MSSATLLSSQLSPPPQKRKKIIKKHIHNGETYILMKTFGNLYVFVKVLMIIPTQLTWNLSPGFAAQHGPTHQTESMPNDRLQARAEVFEGGGWQCYGNDLRVHGLKCTTGKCTGQVPGSVPSLRYDEQQVSTYQQ